MVISHPTPLRAGALLDPVSFNEMRQRLVLDSCKWDPQVGDVETISRFPLFLAADQWKRLSSLAQELTNELIAAELEVIGRTDLHREIGLPSHLRTFLRDSNSNKMTPSAARALRFDFHWTDQGWQISEVNSDVPGGYCEASELALLMSHYYTGTRAEGHPGAAWADAICASAQDERNIVLLVAAGFMEDRQVVAYLSQLLQRRGKVTHWSRLEDLRWIDGYAFLQVGANQIPVGAIVRFYQAEWLKALGASKLFAGGKTPVSNPGLAALTESKRFPLIWHSLSSQMPTWRKLLPQTCDPRDAPWKKDDRWLVKSAFCNTGDTVVIRDFVTARQWSQVKRAVWWNPRDWVAQKRFNILPVETPVGPVFPCIGVYAINGKISGIYGRYSPKPVIDFSAVDVAVLIENEGAAIR